LPVRAKISPEPPPSLSKIASGLHLGDDPPWASDVGKEEKTRTGRPKA
jgi:hypothetical protein